MKQLKPNDIAPYRQAILKKQNGLCLICNQPPIRPVLDHHHTKKNKGTGQIRGVLCSNCNVLLAKMENNAVRYGVNNKRLPLVLQNMSTYLVKPQYPLMHPSEKPKAKRLMKSSWNELKKEGRKEIPPYPKLCRMTKELERLFIKYNIQPKFYGE